MRELNVNEIKEVSGGPIPVGLVYWAIATDIALLTAQWAAYVGLYGKAVPTTSRPPEGGGKENP